jgi:hypothetical protein
MNLLSPTMNLLYQLEAESISNVNISFCKNFLWEQPVPRQQPLPPMLAEAAAAAAARLVHTSLPGSG